MMRFALLVAALCLMAGTVSAAVVVDSGGFESFSLGALNGQFGWAGEAAGTGLAPEVVTSPHPAIGSQAVRLGVCDVQGDASSIGIAVSNLVGSYKTVTVSFDIYRNSVVQNLWWWWWDAGEPTYGLQWDQGGTFPHGWATGAGSATTVLGSYATLKMTWDLDNALAYSWYNGALVDNGIPISNITALTGWTIQLAHDAATGTGADCVYIDNFSVTGEVIPEPGSILALASGLLGLVAIRRRK